MGLGLQLLKTVGMPASQRGRARTSFHVIIRASSIYCVTRIALQDEANPVLTKPLRLQSESVPLAPDAKAPWRVTPSQRGAAAGRLSRRRVTRTTCAPPQKKRGVQLGAPRTESPARCAALRQIGGPRQGPRRSGRGVSPGPAAPRARRSH